jgi:hypothetical protein
MNAKPKRDPDIQTSVLPDGHACLVSEKTEWAHTLTPLAALVWEFCDGNNSVDEIISELKAIPEVTIGPDFKQEVEALLEELSDGGFLLEE